MKIAIHGASATSQALRIVPTPPGEASEARPAFPNSALLSREELRLIVLDIIG